MKRRTDADAEGLDRPDSRRAGRRGGAGGVRPERSATLGGAWYFQFVVGLPPCPLCLEERIPYHVVIPLSLLMAIAAWCARRRSCSRSAFSSSSSRCCATWCSAPITPASNGTFGPGRPTAPGRLSDLTTGGSLLKQLQSIHVVRCDEAAWRFLGISLAGYNVLISLVAGGDRGVRPVRAQARGVAARKPSEPLARRAAFD